MPHLPAFSLYGKMHVICAILFICLLSSCSVFEQLGRNFGEGFESRADSIAGKFVGGAVAELNQTSIDSLLSVVMAQLNDSLRSGTNDARENLIGAGAATDVEALRNVLLGIETQRKADSLIAALRDEALGIQTRAQLDILRDSLLGDQTVARFALIASTLGDALSESYEEGLSKLLQADINRLNELRESISEDVEDITTETGAFVKWITNNVILTFSIIGAIAAGLIALVWHYRRKNIKSDRDSTSRKKIVEILTAQIAGLQNEDPALYEKLKHKIQENTIPNKVEKELREILDEQGILNTSR